MYCSAYYEPVEQDFQFAAMATETNDIPEKKPSNFIQAFKPSSNSIISFDKEKAAKIIGDFLDKSRRKETPKSTPKHVTIQEFSPSSDSKELKEIVKNQEKSLSEENIGQELFTSQSDDSPLEMESSLQFQDDKLN